MSKNITCTAAAKTHVLCLLFPSGYDSATLRAYLKVLLTKLTSFFAKTLLCLLSHCQVSRPYTALLIAQSRSCGHRSQSPACNTRHVLTYWICPLPVESFPFTDRTETSLDLLPFISSLGSKILLMHFGLPLIPLGVFKWRSSRGAIVQGSNNPRHCSCSILALSHC